MKKLVSLVILILFRCNISIAQISEISGKVTSRENEEPLPGVGVQIKGTTIGTVTGLDGSYRLTVPETAQTIVFTCVGLKTSEVNIDGRSVIDIIMETDIFGLGDIIVTGYTTQTRESLTGSVSTVDRDKIKTTATSSGVISQLQGQVSGVTITSDNTPGSENIMVRVRGFGTINDNDPLYIIDGIPTNPRFNLNPNDIESISILKDASSAAIYGTRGANGVVIITTRHGQTGEKLNVDFSFRTGISYPLTHYDVLNTMEYGEIVWLQARNFGFTPGVNFSHPQFGSGVTPIVPDYIFPAGTFTGDPSVRWELYSFPDYPICKASKVGTDWWDEICRTGRSQEYDLSVKGGSENVRYAFSGSWLDEKGYMIYTGFRRISFINNLDARFTKWLKVGESIQVYLTDHMGDLNNWNNNPIMQATLANPIIPVYDVMGNFAGTTAPGTVSAGPVAYLYRARNNSLKHYRILGNIFSEINIFKGLAFKSLLGYNIDFGNNKIYRLADLESNLSSLDALYLSSDSEFQWNWYNFLTYTTSLGGHHNLNINIGTEAIENKYQWFDASRTKYFSNEPDFMQLDVGEINQTNSGSGTEWSLFSLFGRLNYDYLGKYLLDFTLRRDGSSRFGPGNRYATFPAFSVAWTITEENFMAGTRGWMDFLKLRFGWGQSGNDRIGNYNIYSTYSLHNHYAAYDINGTNTSSVVGFQPATRGNPNVTWESTSTLDGGLDAIFLNSTLNFKFDLWRRYTSDMLYQLTYPQVNGTITPPFVNIGEMKNTGFDIEFGYQNNALSGRLRYRLNATLSHYHNEVMKLSDNIEKDIIWASWSARATEGSAFPEFYGYIVDGIFQTQEEADSHPQFTDYNKPGHYKYRNVNGDDVINPDDMTWIGSPHPDLTGGLNIDISYRNFDLNMFFYGTYGNEIVNYWQLLLDFGYNGCNQSKRALYKSWGSPYLDDNKKAVLPLQDFNPLSAEYSSATLENGSYLRMKNLILGYTLPDKLLKRISIDKFRLYFQMSNIFTLTRYSGLDPAFNSNGGEGVDYSVWPTPRQIMFGINLGI